MNFLNYLVSRWDNLLELAIQHAIITAVAVLIATVIGVGLGVATYRTERPRELVIAIASVFLTIPSLALFGLFIPVFGLGATPVVVALVMYALLPIVANTIVGLRGVDPAIVESAQGMGMGRTLRLIRIELPLAWPVILTGMRVSTLITLGIAAIGAYIRGPGLGNDIFRGLARIGSPVALNLVLGGILGVVVLAVLFDLLYVLINRLTTTRGIR
ncbi:ABC transporter permease [Pseudonocardia asaccharolytica]|uniref:ABC transporter permease n=1 Tax=Pseudonocardia asaccharolytica DSM 44247 = NBRC 16224 TaxID=1123024 RepID=A0A511D2X3_9PSEU|nr:ABC transporter permease [Pseudonocardia asaccharolytica]GEL19129.1 ABC transporter permease [Pseudonocardia asaccharolytica DSM 44247 = NBRC 16224]